MQGLGRANSRPQSSCSSFDQLPQHEDKAKRKVAESRPSSPSQWGQSLKSEAAEIQEAEVWC